MVVVCILSVMFIVGVILFAYGIKKDKNSFVIYGVASILFTGTFLCTTIFILTPTKEYINGFIENYNFTKHRIDVINKLDPNCEGSKDAINILSIKLENEVEYINKTIEFNRSRLGTWNEYFISKEIANLEEIEYSYEKI